MRLVHLSDLHLHGPQFVHEWADRLLVMVNEQQPDVLVITGDLIEEGFEHEYEAACRYLNNFDCDALVVVPGDCDVRNNGGLIFREVFGPRCPYYETDEAVIVGVDSTQPDLTAGYVGNSYYELLRRRFATQEEKVKILALHHHLLPVPGAGRETDIVQDAGDVLDLCNRAGVDLVLSGHLHRSWIWHLEDTYFVSAGTPTTRRMKARTSPSFYRIDLDEWPAITEIDVRQQTSRTIPINLRATSAIG